MRIGVVGGGQLGRMLGLAGIPLGFDFTFLDPASDPPSAAVGDVIGASYDDDDALRELASRSNILTYEFENVVVEQLARVAEMTTVFPPPDALAWAQDRKREKEIFAAAGIPVAEWRSVDSRRELDGAVRTLGLPLVLKTRRFGYDGKGQHRIRSETEIDAAWGLLGGQPLIAETLVPFEYEVSAIGVRGEKETRIYPLVQNDHREGILNRSRAPIAESDLHRQARYYIEALISRLNYRGTIAVEFFVFQGRLLGNEFAPRVHNSGHWTIEGTNCSQFENHLRAISGLPLGDCSAVGYSGMVNLIGTMPAARDILAVRGAHLHDYRKMPRPGRKLGHVTVVAASARERDEQLERLTMITDHAGD